MAIVLAAWPSMALASGNEAKPDQGRQSYESCMMARALALEPSGAEIGEIVAAAQRDCQTARDKLANSAVGEIAHEVRLAVMQQRSNALNTRRRG